MFANIRSKLIRRYWQLERNGFTWRRGNLVIELEPVSDLITVRREAHPDCHRCQGTGSLYEQTGTRYDREVYYDYAGPCPHCPEPRLYASFRGRVAVAVRLALVARPKVRQRISNWYRKPLRLQWRRTWYLLLEVDRHDRYVTLERLASGKCPDCMGAGYLTAYKDDYDEVYAGPCPTCPRARLLAKIAWGPRKPEPPYSEMPF